MRILYGIVGEGMGHATRSRVVLEHLLRAGHEVEVVVSGKAHGFMQQVLADSRRARVHEIRGFNLRYAGGGLDLPASARQILGTAPQSLMVNIKRYRALRRDGFKPDVVVSDFESWAYVYGLVHDVPVVSIDNIQALHRCQHPKELLHDAGFARLTASAAVKLKLPGAEHYVVTSFFFPNVRKGRTTLVPPLLRPEILSAKRERGEHVLVYQTAGNETPLELLQRLPYEVRVYGAGRDERHGNVSLKPFSQQGFIDDLRTARAVIATGGFSLMSEAVHLGVPMLAVPIAGQFEQELNARYLQYLGYGSFTEELTLEAMAAFLWKTDEHEAALQGYARQDNQLALETIERVLRAAVGPATVAA